MAFSGFSFVFIFLPALLAVYFLIPNKAGGARNAVLLAFGLVFYACAGLRAVPVLCVSVAANYAFGLLSSPERRGSRAFCILGCAFNLALLAVYKYAGFFAVTLNGLGAAVSVPQIALPLGVSFFTFKGMSYILDVRRGAAGAERRFLRVALYITFFPQVASGPIGRWGELEPYFDSRRAGADSVRRGLVRFCFGLAKKLIIADGLGVMVDELYLSSGALTAALAWIAAIGYSLQIYFDFSGYSDMAIGVARVFGFETPENFNYPYIADSVPDFWRRWHISLSQWFRDYVYIPLGGNRRGNARLAVNLIVVWALTGLWHGASWTFVAWGLYYALLIMGNRFIWGRLQMKLPRVIRIMLTFIAATVGWVMFRSADFTQLSQVLGAMFGAAPFTDERSTYYLLEYGWLLIVALVAALPVKPRLEAYLKSRADSPAASFIYRWAPPLLALGLLGLSYIVMIGSTYNSFIYFNF